MHTTEIFLSKLIIYEHTNGKRSIINSLEENCSYTNQNDHLLLDKNVEGNTLFDCDFTC